MASKQDSGTKGRKPLPAAAIEGDVMDAEALAERSQQIAVAGELQAAFNRDQYEVTRVISQRMGRSQILRSFAKLVMAADLEDLRQIKESKQYKGFQCFDLSGKSSPVTTWEEYCRLVEGRSVEIIDNDLKNYAALGAEGFDALRQLGFGPAKMRELRREGFSEEDRATLIEVAKAGDKETLLDLTEEIIARQRVQRDRQQAAQDQLEADNSTLAKELSQTREQLDAAKSKAALLPRMKADKKADYMLAELEKAFAEARTANRNVAQACAAFLDYTSDNALDFDQDVSARTVELDNLLLALVMDLRIRGIDQPHENALVVLGGV